MRLQALKEGIELESPRVKCALSSSDAPRIGFYMTSEYSCCLSRKRQNTCACVPTLVCTCTRQLPAPLHNITKAEHRVEDPKLQAEGHWDEDAESLDGDVVCVASSEPAQSGGIHDKGYGGHEDTRDGRLKRIEMVLGLYSVPGFLVCLRPPFHSYLPVDLCSKHIDAPGRCLSTEEGPEVINVSAPLGMASHQ